MTEAAPLKPLGAIRQYFERDRHVSLTSRRLAAYQKLLDINLSAYAAKQLLAQWDEALRPPAPSPPRREDIAVLLSQAQPAPPPEPERIPIGQALRKAGLLSPAQIEVILNDQAHDTSLRFGDILALRGWLNATTVDFFIEQLPHIALAQSRSPIGQYLKQAGLLNDTQVDLLLDEQRYVKQRFGQLAVDKGWVKQATVDVLLESLCSHPAKPKALVARRA